MNSQIDLNPPRGMRDFLPKDWIFRQKLMNAFTKAAEACGFLRYETPVVDSYELFERKAGEEISEQLYDFEDKSGRHIALRAELTPSMARVYFANQEQFPSVAKIYSIGQCFRYERATKGRKREHFQWNIDILGEKSVSAEAWLLFTAVRALNLLGLDNNDFQVYVSSRSLLSDYLVSIGVNEEKHAELMVLIDKKEKIPAEVLHDSLKEAGMNEKQISQLFCFLEVKKIDELALFVPEDNEGLQQLKELFDKANALGISAYLKLNTSIIRGLSYYTGIVFEAFDCQKEFRAIFGGGRYDHLFLKMMDKDIPACGLGFGDVVIEELCAAKFGRATTFAPVRLVLGYFDSSLQKQAMALASAFIQKGVDCDLALSAQAPKKFFTQANKRGAAFTVYLAPEEAEKNQFVLKNMKTGEQSSVDFSQIEETARRLNAEN